MRNFDSLGAVAIPEQDVGRRATDPETLKA